VSEANATCAVCGRSSDEVPLVRLTFRGKDLSVCPEEMPKLIHNPEQLAGSLPGAENLTGA